MFLDDKVCVAIKPPEVRQCVRDCVREGVRECVSVCACVQECAGIYYGEHTSCLIAKPVSSGVYRKCDPGWYLVLSC